MARVLVKLISATASLNSLYEREKRGDVVKVVEDGYYFGDKIEGSRNPKFGIIDLPGVPVARLLSLVEAETAGTGDAFRIVRRRVRRLNLGTMTTEERGDLEGAERKVSLSEARLSALVEDRPRG